MTVKEFTDINDVSIVQVLIDYNLIINLVVGETSYGLDVDTSNVPNGTPLSDISDFIISGDILDVGGIQIDMTQVDMLDG